MVLVSNLLRHKINPMWIHFLTKYTKSKYHNYEREIQLTQRDMDALKSHENINDFKDFWIYGNSNHFEVNGDRKLGLFNSKKNSNGIPKGKMLEPSKQHIHLAGGFITPKMSLNKGIKHSLNTGSINISDGIGHEIISRTEVKNNFLMNIPNGHTPLNLSIKHSNAIIVKNPPRMAYKASSHKINSVNLGEDTNQ